MTRHWNGTERGVERLPFLLPQVCTLNISGRLLAHSATFHVSTAHVKFIVAFGFVAIA
jgi:hypothetical protein